MPYFSCEGCDQTINISVFEHDVRREYCPVCEEQTVWSTEFDGDGSLSL